MKNPQPLSELHYYDRARQEKWRILSTIKNAFHLKKGETEQPLIRRLTLHASSLRFHHPERQEFMTLAATETKDFNTVVRNLRKYAAK